MSDETERLDGPRGDPRDGMRPLAPPPAHRRGRRVAGSGVLLSGALALVAAIALALGLPLLGARATPSPVAVRFAQQHIAHVPHLGADEPSAVQRGTEHGTDDGSTDPHRDRDRPRPPL